MPDIITTSGEFDEKLDGRPQYDLMLEHLDPSMVEMQFHFSPPPTFKLRRLQPILKVWCCYKQRLTNNLIFRQSYSMRIKGLSTRHLPLLFLCSFLFANLYRFDASAATNLLVNGDFSAGLTGWSSNGYGPGGPYPQVVTIGYSDGNTSVDWLRMILGNGSVGYVEQQVQLPSNPVVLSFGASGPYLDPVTAIISLTDEGGAVHVLDTFELATAPKTNFYSLAGFAGQNIKIRLSASASNGSAAVVSADFNNVVVSSPDFVLWTGGVGNWSDPSMWLLGPPSNHNKTVVPAGSFITVDLTNAQTGDLSLDPGSSLVIQSGATLGISGSATNNGRLQILAGGSLIWIPAVGNSNGFTLIQNGSFEIFSGGSAGVATAIDAINGLAFSQTNGSTRVAGVFNCGNGTISLGGGTLDVPNVGQIGNLGLAGTDSLAFLQTGGTFTLNGNLTAGSAVLQGGTLSGAGNVNGDFRADAGLLAPGLAGGALTFTGNFTQTEKNLLLLQVQSTGVGQFDQLRVGGAVQLGGTLSVRQLPGFAPNVGDQLQLLSSSNLSGRFSPVSVPIGTFLAYSNNGVFLIVTDIGASIVNFRFSFNSVSNRSYTVVQSDDLGAGTWSFYTNLVGTGEVIQMIVPVGSFRQHFFNVRTP